jgi:dCTP deaminase
MTFWSSQTLKARLPAKGIVAPFDEDRIVHAAYEMGIGPEAFVTSNPGDKTQLASGDKLVIPPGQFGLLITRERVHIPPNVIAFISMRASIKFQGLINVSGFHVDPGFRGQLKFSVFNAGSRSIVLDQDQRVFMIWFADLDQPDANPYPERQQPPFVIAADDVARMQGEVASPAELKTQLDDLKVELDKRFHTSEQTRLNNRYLITVLIGLVLAAVGKPYLDRILQREKSPSETSSQGVLTPVPVRR